MTEDEVFAENVRIAREHALLSQADLSRLLGRSGLAIPQQTIWRIEVNRRRVSVGEATYLAAALNLTVDELLDPAFAPRPASLYEATKIVEAANDADPRNPREARRLELAIELIAESSN